MILTTTMMELLEDHPVKVGVKQENKKELMIQGESYFLNILEF